MKGDPQELGFATRAIHGGQPPEPRTGAVTVPIFQTSTYVQEELGGERRYAYSRVRNPTRSALEENLRLLESGFSAHTFSSGMAAISALMTLLRSGDHAVVAEDVYGGTYRLFRQILERYGLQFTWVDTTRPEAIAEAMRETTRLIYVETPSNPMMRITDIAAIADFAHRHGVLLAVDNTFLSPFLQRPLELGADLVLHSTTKYLNGHSDSLGGALVTSRPEHAEWFAFVQKTNGWTLAPFECFLILRGIKTLAVRMRQHEANARTIARFLAGHPAVKSVLYPGLEEHAGYALQRSQADGFGAMLSLDLGSYAAAKIFLERLRVMSLAESLGGVESLACHPATMTHAVLTAEERERLGIVDGLVRLSVGIENLEDLVADLEQALAG